MDKWKVYLVMFVVECIIAVMILGMMSLWQTDKAQMQKDEASYNQCIDPNALNSMTFNSTAFAQNLTVPKSGLVSENLGGSSENMGVSDSVSVSVKRAG